MMESANRDARRCARTTSLCGKIPPCGSRPPSLRGDGSCLPDSRRAMCLMMYLATAGDQPLRSSAELSGEEVESSRTSVRQWFSLPTVRFIGAHTGCSCGFPSVIAEEPIEYYDG